MPFVKHDDDGKGEGSRLSRFFRKGDKKSDGGSVGVPMHISTKSLILDESKESRSSRRTDLNRAKTEHHLLTSKRNNRALSPTTKRRIERSLGIGDISVISAPTVLNYDDADVSQAHSNPPAKRHSLESDARGLLVSRRNQSTRSMRRLHSSAPSVSQLAFEKKTVNSNLESVEKGRVEESTALQSVATAQLVSNRKTDTLKANIKIPKGVVSIVITDIEGSTMMWEQNPSAMKDALNVHDSIIRRCYVKQSGYEIATEGDSFRLAFHHPLDALSFCLDCQTKLFNANWTNGILELQNAEHIPDRQMRGLRVRMVVHHGQTTSRTHETTHRIFFKGEGVDIAKALEKVSHGGQIVTNVETWKEVSGLAERHLGSPQILDLGKHDLKGKGNVIHTQRLLQLVPKRLAFDYCTFRGTVEQFTRPEGRTFPPPKTYRQLSTSFFDAPYVENKVCIAFINTVTAREMNTDDLAEESCKLAKMIRSLLIRTKPPAYECQEDNGFWMLAFHSSGSSIMFGLTLIEKLQRSDSPLLVQIGVHCGNFASMGPHTVTGRADYFGPVVNRAARIASHSETGQVRLGIPKPELKDFQSPKIKDVQVRYLGTEMYKGINVKMCLFACIPFSSKESELGIKNGEKTHRRMSLIHDTARCP